MDKEAEAKGARLRSKFQGRGGGSSSTLEQVGEGWGQSLPQYIAQGRPVMSSPGDMKILAA